MVHLFFCLVLQCLETMIDLGCDLDGKNFQGNTALHIMVARGRLACVISLLSHGANVNAVGSDGDRPLHIAVKSDVSVIQALIVYGADVNSENDKGETPRHLASVSKVSKKDQVLYTLHAVGARRCPRDHGCADGCSANGSFDGAAPDKPNFFKASRLYDDLMGASIVKGALERRNAEMDTGQPRHRSRVLCLDGGGIRGLIIIQMLVALEAILECPILDCFDWVAGTSTGGVLALLLACGNYSALSTSFSFPIPVRVYSL